MKKPGEIVSNVDIQINKDIINYFKKYPKYGIISEEFQKIKSKSEYNWIIDPLDGSRNFINFLDAFFLNFNSTKKIKRNCCWLYL